MNDEQYADWAKTVRDTNPPGEANRILTTGPGPEQHAATIRKPLELMVGVLNDEACSDALAALDALVALAQLSDEADAALTHGQAAFITQGLRLEAAEERASQLEQDRDDVLDRESGLADALDDVRRQRDEARREADQLRVALRRAETTLSTITDRFIPGIDTWEDTDAEETLEVVRAALAGVQDGEQT